MGIRKKVVAYYQELARQGTVRQRPTTSAVGLAFERIRGINDALNEQLMGSGITTWWSLSTNDQAGTVPTYICLWSRRHKYKNGRDVPDTGRKLHNHVRFLFHGPIKIAEKLVKDGSLVETAKSSFRPNIRLTGPFQRIDDVV